MYYNGYGVEKHLPTAEYHLKTGIDNGDEKAIPLYKETLKKLNGINI
jgi:TPR repeat protein